VNGATHNDGTLAGWERRGAEERLTDARKENLVDCRSSRLNNEEEMQSPSWRRLVRISRRIDLKAAACSFLLTQFVIGAITEPDAFVGLPCFLFYNRIFQLMLKVWSGCYGVAGEFGLTDLECEFIFRWFLLGGVLDNDGIQITLALMLRLCLVKSNRTLDSYS
jgi:hypothetical protein